MRTKRCDECGRESSIELSKWLDVTQITRSDRDEPMSRDFCSEKCIATFYTRRTYPSKSIDFPGVFRMVMNKDIPEGEIYFINEDGNVLSVKLKDEDTNET